MITLKPATCDQFKTGHFAFVRRGCLNLTQSGRFSGDNKWPLLGDYRGMRRVCHQISSECSGQKPHEHRRIFIVTHTAISGVHVLCGLRQSIPSSSIESCARDRHTVPSVACGQMNRPFSNRFANRHRPSPSNQRHFTMSPLRPRNKKTWPENGCCCNTV